MKYVFNAPLFLLLMVVFATAQSGRRTTATPTPNPTPIVSHDPQYSESAPTKARAKQVTERFPGIGDGSSTKPAADQTAPTAKTGSADDEEIVRVETNLITIPVSVFDRNGLYIPGLRKDNFTIFEDGKPQEIAYFGTTDKPFTVVLLLDVSPSTAYKIDEIHQAAVAFVDQLQPQDSVIVIEFDRGLDVLTEATNDREKIYNAIRKARFGEGTSLYNAVDETLRKHLNRITGRKAVVLFTDGVDTTSRRRTYDGTVDYAEESDSMIFPIYYNTFFDQGGGGLGNINGGVIPGRNNGNVLQAQSPEEYALGRRYLQDLADVTGGRVFRPESTPGGLTAAFEGIAEELRRQYNIGYIPAETGTAGQRKRIKVRVDRPNLVLRARDSYIVGATATQDPTSSKKDK